MTVDVTPWQLLLPPVLLPLSRILPDIGLGEQRVEFPEGVNPLALHGKVGTSNLLVQETQRKANRACRKLWRVVKS